MTENFKQHLLNQVKKHHDMKIANFDFTQNEETNAVINQLENDMENRAVMQRLWGRIYFTLPDKLSMYSESSASSIISELLNILNAVQNWSVRKDIYVSFDQMVGGYNDEIILTFSYNVELPTNDIHSRFKHPIIENMPEEIYDYFDKN